MIEEMVEDRSKSTAQSDLDQISDVVGILEPNFRFLFALSLSISSSNKINLTDSKWSSAFSISSFWIIILIKIPFSTTASYLAFLVLGNKFLKYCYIIHRQMI